MTFAFAAWLAWAVIAVAGVGAAWLFLLKLRPPRIPVPSLLLWRRVLDESRDLTWWERIRRVVSLVATIAIAVALGLAAVRPSRTAANSASRQRLLIVLDSSWSMLGRTRSGETRWERAIAEARRLSASSAGDDVALATTADGVIEGPTGDPALIETALDRARPAGGEGSSWPRLAGIAAVHFITDGSVARPIDPDVVIHSVFEPAPNVGITAFDVRPLLNGRAGAAVYIEVGNFSAASQMVHVSMTRGTTSLIDRRVEMAAGESIRQVLPLSSAGDRRLVARVEASDDALAADNQALAWIERAQPLRLTVVGDDTAWLAALLAQNSDITATFVRPAEYHAADTEDVVLFDRCVPPQAPSRPSILLAPPSSSWLGAAIHDERRPRWSTPGSHPVVQGVDPLTLSIEKAHGYDGAGLVPVAQSAGGTPLVYVEESPARLVVVTFSRAESNLAFAPALPVLIGNALDWLSRPEAAAARQPGLMPLAESDVSLKAENGATMSVLHVGGATLGVPIAPGLYTIEHGGARNTIAVNIGNPQVSNLSKSVLAASTRAQAVAAGASSRALWIYCALAAFLLVLIEWWTWQRRITV
jgi:hypothetical protein